MLFLRCISLYLHAHELRQGGPTIFSAIVGLRHLDREGLTTQDPQLNRFGLTASDAAFILKYMQY